MKGKILALFFALFLFGPIYTVNAQGQPPDLTTQPVLSAKGSRFLAGWNYFTLGFSNCTAMVVFDEIQAAGGASLEVKEIFLQNQNQWQKITLEDQTALGLSVAQDQIIAFDANLPFFLGIDQKTCQDTNAERKRQIETLRTGAEKNSKSFLSQLASIPADFWSGVLNTLGFSKNEPVLEATPGAKLETDSLSVFNTLNVFGKSTMSDLGLTGKLTVGLLQLDDLDGSINSIQTLKFQNNLGGNIDFLNGLVAIDTSGNVFIEGKIVARKSTGTSIIKAGQSSVIVSVSLAGVDSKVFVTPLGNPQGSLYIQNKSEGQFTVAISKPVDYDLSFDWWVIN